MLRPLHLEDSKEIYEAMKDNVPVQLMQSGVYRTLGTSVAKTRETLTIDLLGMMQESSYIRLGIFILKEGKAYFVGKISISPNTRVTKKGEQTIINIAYLSCAPDYLKKTFGYQPKVLYN